MGRGGRDEERGLDVGRGRREQEGSGGISWGEDLG